jgi:hypothetical protein
MARTLVQPALLSGSAEGLGIKVAATSSPGTTLHTTSATKLERIWLSVYNSHTATVVLTIQWGGTTSPDHDIKQTINFRSGEILVVAGRLLTGARVIKAYASVADVLIISGEVEQVTIEGA